MGELSSNARRLLPALAVGLLAACGGGPVVVSPEDFPPIESSWADLTLQLPARSDGVLLISLDELTREQLSNAAGALDTLSSVDMIGDLLGVDLSTDSAFDQLGLRLGGSAGLALVGDDIVFIIDLAEPDAMRDILDRMAERNPDLSLQRREIDGDEVLRFELPLGATASGEQVVDRLYLTVTERQLVGLLNRVRFGQTDESIDLLMGLREPRANNLRFNPDFARAVRDLGGSSWALYMFEVAAVFDLMTSLSTDRPDATEHQPEGGFDPAAALDVGGFFGASPGPQRCAEVARATAIAVPVVDAVIERERLADPPGVREHQRFRLHVAPAYDGRATELLQAPHIDQGLLAERAPLAGYLRLDRAVLTEHIAQFSDAAACPTPAVLTGLLAQGAALLADSEFIGAQVDGLVLGSLFDFRNTGGVPFADVFFGLGSEEPASLSQSVQRLFEDELGMHGSPEVAGGFQTISYRFALLYRVALIEGARLLGITMGLIDEGWLQAMLTPTESDTGSFLWMQMDGSRMQPIYDTLVDLALMGVEDEAMRESQRDLFEASMGELRRLRDFVLTGSYEEGSVNIEVIERWDDPIPEGAVQATAP